MRHNTIDVLKLFLFVIIFNHFYSEINHNAPNTFVFMFSKIDVDNHNYSLSTNLHLLLDLSS